ncbi:uncharacterized protein B0T15DRAFT_11460 [Chaetomium strumarium]|uniref:SprT-like domain-containing protein n=1 Tax=Chaetomium strumarium TaxID=1170767 RepID=A0AAJ0H186_9PEZI|nr:hypothetical protein B0T15DRAFT_11460 [Chaetomium strumarium]
MAHPAAGGDDYPPFPPLGGYHHPVKRRIPDTVDDDDHRHLWHKRPKYTQPAQFAEPVAYKAVDEPLLSYTPLYQPRPHHVPHRYPSPLPHLPSPEPAGGAAPAMERTASGHSILPDPTERCASTELLEDHEAAQRVRDHLASFRRRNPDSKHERILRSIINPRPRRRRHHHQHHGSQPLPADTAEEEDYPLDNDALESIFSAANEIFFNGRLSQRVTWDWSHSSSTRYDSRVIGTTALRRAAASTRGFETLIVLSSTILRDPRFSRRLLISTFLHELIHSYLFICCGFRARWCGGHTPGFREIAGVIDEWIGEGSGLFLSRVEADLELFRIGRCRHDQEADGGGFGMERGNANSEEQELGRAVHVYPCSGMVAEQDEYAVDVAATPPTPQEVVSTTYFGRGTFPRSPPGPAPHEVVQFYNDRPVSRDGGGRNTPGWRQQHRAVRPLYVYTGAEPMVPYVYPNGMLQKP